MIIFKHLRWKNFLSTGDNWSEIDLRKSKTTLIVGHNGAGKSTMLDALSYALFGKAHRNISKAQLVNSINKKGAVVELDFNVSGRDYKIIRGVKPNIFEIYVNGVMINQDSHAKEYQKILEQNIIKLNHKSFHQIVVLGSSSFIPFMQLSSQHRREVIEDLLDINVFSKMNQILKEKTSGLKENIKDCNHQIEVLKAKIDAQKKYIKDVEALNNEQREEKLKLIEEYQSEIGTLQRQNSSLSEDVDSKLEAATAAKSKADREIQEVNKFKTQFSTQITRLVKEVEFFESNDTCPTCSQSITEETKAVHVQHGKTRARELKEGITEANQRLERLGEVASENSKIISDCNEKQSLIASNNRSISQFQNAIDRTQREIDSLGKATDVNDAKEELDAYKADQDSYVERKLTLNEQFNYNLVIAEMLKDSGIKTKIVKQYIPVINQLVNQYLQVLDFFVSFNLDENFSETIKSRHRDDFSYASFSEGEKQRIDLALLFTWRQIAKMKNSVATNLLILDETFDSSLDHEGVDNLMKILYTLGDDTNVFVISHKGEILEGRFANKIEFHKEKNFSRIK